jgi:hypothetical protein
MALRPAAKKRKRENRKEAGKSSSQAVGIGVCKPKQRREEEHRAGMYKPISFTPFNVF